MESRVHLGPVASGREVARDDHLRQELAARLGILAFDSEFDSVLESVIGNRRDAFVVIRGIADYKVNNKSKVEIEYKVMLLISNAFVYKFRTEQDGEIGSPTQLSWPLHLPKQSSVGWTLQLTTRASNSVPIKV